MVVLKRDGQVSFFNVNVEVVYRLKDKVFISSNNLDLAIKVNGQGQITLRYFQRNNICLGTNSVGLL